MAGYCACEVPADRSCPQRLGGSTSSIRDPARTSSAVSGWRGVRGAAEQLGVVAVAHHDVARAVQTIDPGASAVRVHGGHREPAGLGCEHPERRPGPAPRPAGATSSAPHPRSRRARRLCAVPDAPPRPQWWSPTPRWRAPECGWRREGARAARAGPGTACTVTWKGEVGYASSTTRAPATLTRGLPLNRLSLHDAICADIAPVLTRTTRSASPARSQSSESTAVAITDDGSPCAATVTTPERSTSIPAGTTSTGTGNRLPVRRSVSRYHPPRLLSPPPANRAASARAPS